MPGKSEHAPFAVAPRNEMELAALLLRQARQHLDVLTGLDHDLVEAEQQRPFAVKPPLERDGSGDL